MAHQAKFPNLLKRGKTPASCSVNRNQAQRIMGNHLQTLANKLSRPNAHAIPSSPFLLDLYIHLKYSGCLPRVISSHSSCLTQFLVFSALFQAHALPRMHTCLSEASWNGFLSWYCSIGRTSSSSSSQIRDIPSRSVIMQTHSLPSMNQTKPIFQFEACNVFLTLALEERLASH